MRTITHLAHKRRFLNELQERFSSNVPLQWVPPRHPVGRFLAAASQRLGLESTPCLFIYNNPDYYGSGTILGGPTQGTIMQYDPYKAAFLTIVPHKSRPTILLNQKIVQNETAADIAVVLAHEIAHLTPQAMQASVTESEYAADEGSARVVSPERVIAFLSKRRRHLHEAYIPDNCTLDHPSYTKRIAHLQNVFGR